MVCYTVYEFNRSGLTVEGVFRVGGSEKRVRELQDIFDTPPNVRMNSCSHLVRESY